ncbi:probable E3 ubiquitin-protein ligase HERC4 isoform X2 [Anoplopoma fimbria]|uniref:probable E3 ubiquitin-protein ligase HERC4 isoform X2 n=1 Tax=Anoplopoma fimbria TaxID=229290 RepID=UPI0023EBAD97|nr:probable E3 ubiquitin-protein ligase HERC4 isoform X2 [Anoplopoma fimbria]
MFAWGEDGHRGFRLQDGAYSDGRPAADAGVGRLNLGYNIADLSAGRSALAFVKTNGNAFVIRTNEREDGTRVKGKQKFIKYKEKILAVGCGDDMVILLSEGGEVLCVDTAQTYNPKPLKALSNIQVSQVACGSQHSVALTKGGQVYTWGQDSRGQLGLGRRKPGANSPQHLRSLSGLPLVQVAAGGEQSFALSVSGGVSGWGRNDRGQLGLGDTTDRHTPTPVHCLNMKTTIHISCGKDHTAILTKNGAVFTFGSGQYGQLGHNSFSDELRPRLVAELLGAKVTKIACGRHHTLVLTDSKKVYSFGCGEQGQLGHGEESHPSVPLPVQLTQDTDDARVRNIFAGGNCSFAACASNEDVPKQANADGVNNKTQHRLDDMIDKWTSKCDSKSWKKIKQEIHRTFSSASCVNISFLEQSKDKHFQTSTKYPGLNLSLARLAFEKLVKKDNVFAEVEAAVLLLLPSLDKKPLAVEGLRIYLLLNELLHVIQRHEQRRTSTELAEAVAAAVLNLSADSLQVIGDWWSSLPSSTMVEHVNVWKQALSVILSLKPVPRDSGVRNLLLVLQYMYNANSRIAEPQRMPERDFCLLIDKNFLNQDLQLWRLRSQHKYIHSEPLILCSFPILMDLESKKYVFDLNANCTKVYFDENTAIDILYKKDFFHEVFHEMMSAETGMFMFNDSNTLAWFPSKATEEDQRYLQFGVLCGLALYNECIIHLPFPLALFKKLLGVKPSLEDMIDFSPRVGESLLNILEDYDDDDIKNLYMDFLINWDGTEVDLDPKNPEKPLTGENKKEFVNAYVNHAFNTSVEGVFQEFKRGFFQVCDQDLVKLFRPKELQEVLVGKDFHDWAKLKQNTGYEGEYNTTPPHPTIQMFWEVFDELTEDQKKAFLWFVTGFERVPILGMETMKMTVRVKQVQDHSYDQYYPETHTCYSILELPLYSTKEIMHTKLTEALSNNRRIYK